MNRLYHTTVASLYAVCFIEEIWISCCEKTKNWINSRSRSFSSSFHFQYQWIALEHREFIKCFLSISPFRQIFAAKRYLVFQVGFMVETLVSLRSTLEKRAIFFDLLFQLNIIFRLMFNVSTELQIKTRFRRCSLFQTLTLFLVRSPRMRRFGFFGERKMFRILVNVYFWNNRTSTLDTFYTKKSPIQAGSCVGTNCTVVIHENSFEQRVVQIVVFKRV